MAKVTVVMTGDKAINRKLKRLSGKEQKSVVRKAIRPALKPVLQQARGNAKEFKRTGKLSRSIKIRSMKRSRTRFGARVTTGTSTSDYQGKAFYGAFLEYGWKSAGSGRKNEGRHYMKDAAKTKQAEAIRIYRNGIRQGILNLARR